MRFSLAAIFALIALCAGGITMYRAYGWYGLVFLLPHVAVVTLSYWLFLTRRSIAVITVVAIYLGLWTHTAWVAAPKLRQHLTPVDGESGVPFASDWSVVDFNPKLSGRFIETPWCYVANVSSPCPAVLVFDAGFHTGECGSGGRNCGLSFIDCWFDFPGGVYWSSS